MKNNYSLIFFFNVTLFKVGPSGISILFGLYIQLNPTQGIWKLDHGFPEMILTSTSYLRKNNLLSDITMYMFTHIFISISNIKAKAIFSIIFKMKICVGLFYLFIFLWT